MNLIFYIISTTALAFFGWCDIESSQWFGRYDFNNPLTGNHQRNYEANPLFRRKNGTLNTPLAVVALVASLVLHSLLFYFGSYTVQFATTIFFGGWAVSRFISAKKNWRQKDIAFENYLKYKRGEI